ncbi:MAG TPA: hypothetical protein VE863_10945 [Pyrinomonadaceae bacterium]|nr:hypothetical protein [Pyrinomonadaceae bacterium]
MCTVGLMAIASILVIRSGLSQVLNVDTKLKTGLSQILISDAEHPSDAELEKVFNTHESDFNQLVTMSGVDARVVRISPTFTWLDDNANWPRPESQLGFSIERWNEYRKLFVQLGLKEGIARCPDGNTIEFIASTDGLLTGGSEKGYIYSTKKLSPIYNSLDHLEPMGKHVYKRLQPPHWYLFYHSD